MKERRDLTGCENGEIEGGVWKLKRIEPQESIDPARACEEEGWLPISKMPAQVADILYENGLLPEEYRVGWCCETLWIERYDWLYCCRFRAKETRGAGFLFEGLDTFADIWLNGIRIGRHEDFYLPQEIDVSGLIREENVLLLHFHRVSDILEAKEWDEKWEGAVTRCKQIRKPIHDFPPEGWSGEEESNYQGAVPYFTPIGVYGKIFFLTWQEGRLEEVWANISVDETYDGTIRVRAKGFGPDSSLAYEVWYGEERVQEGDLPLERMAEERFEADAGIHIRKPQLWNPRGFGEQHRYLLRILLRCDGKTADVWERMIGFRRVEMPSCLEYRINGKKVRLWGGSMDPMQGYTHCYCEERAQRLFEMVENAHMNTLRIWGEGIPQPDAFYEEADRRGILVWQEFFLGHGAYPDTDEIKEACQKEAEALVKRLAHHPSLLMWCGGNETIMGAEFAGKYPFGKEILLKTFPEVVKRLDEGRYYHPNSPYGGEWSNDPREGDYHTYDCVWQYPYQDYPAFISEHIRTAPPAPWSLRRMVKQGDWPKEGELLDTYAHPFIWPQHWMERTHPGAKGIRKTGPYWEFHEAGNEEDMIYRFAAAYGQEIRRYGEQIRRGTKDPESSKRSKGYFACKLLDTWPKVYCAPIDFFQEGYIPYYALARLFEPVLLSFEKGESIRLWLVNDSDRNVEGTVTVGIYLPVEERFLRKDVFQAQVPQGEAEMVFDLAAYQFFPKDCILYAKLEEADQKKRCEAIDYVDIERHYRYGEANLEAELCEEELILQSDAFVRCVELTGSCGEDPFGWLFSDNYFDLMPGETKRVKVRCPKEEGKIRIKGHYLQSEKTVDYHRK